MTRYALVGTGHRASMFFKAVTDTFADRCEMVALCDLNPVRMAFYNRKLTDRGKPAAPTWQPEQFEQMIAQARPDVVIVCTRDCDHDGYIIRAMQLGCDVITEKPMTTDEHKCKAVLDAIAATGRRCTVTFNARYGPPETQVKQLLADGVIGRVLSVNYEHLLDIRHGADYFRRWHRDKANSGGLMVHKCTHCFDLVNWWVDAAPVSVTARGGVQFYGPGPERPSGLRCRGCQQAGQCKFYIDISASDERRALYLEAEQVDGYYRDQCVFGEGITTEDSVAVIVGYDSGTILSYQLTAFAPYEGSRVVFNGTQGRLELTEIANTQWSVTPADATGATQHKPAGPRIEVFPHHGPAYTVDIAAVQGGHGGADTLIVRDLFGPPRDRDPLGHQADHFDGARSILIGIAANRSMQWARPVSIGELVKLPPRG